VGLQLLGLAHSVGLPLWSFDFRPCLLATLRAATPPLLLQANLLLGVHVSLQWRAANLVSVEDVPPLPYRYVTLNGPAFNQLFGPGWKHTLLVSEQGCYFTSVSARGFQLLKSSHLFGQHNTNKAARRQAHLLWKVAAVLLHTTGDGKQQQHKLIDQTEPYTRDGATDYKATCRRR